MSDTNTTALKPFHESIVDAIYRVRPKYPSKSDQQYWDRLYDLADLIRSTKIPAGHDAIITAWQSRTERFGLNELAFRVVESVLVQKEAAKWESRKKEKAQLVDGAWYEFQNANEATEVHCLVDKDGFVREIVLKDQKGNMFEIDDITAFDRTVLKTGLGFMPKFG